MHLLEFWNEYDHMVEGQGVQTSTIAGWHREMADYLAEVDPYDHIITTSLSHNDYGDLWELPEMQFTQRHLYGGTDGLRSIHLNYGDRYDKPFVAGEFSLDWVCPPTDTPAAYGREVHMALWRGMFSPTPILPMTWWWEFHADNDHYFHFEHASTFSALTAEGGGPLENQPVTASPNLEAVALESPLGRFVWIHNRSGSPTQLASFTLTELPNGAVFQERSFLPWTGVWSDGPTTTVNNGALTTTVLLGADEDRAFISGWSSE